MPEPRPDPNAANAQRVAWFALIAGAILALAKFGIFALTNSVAVLSDAFESLINIAAAGVMCFAIWYANQPADESHRYGHGKVEFLVVGLEGWMILIAALVIAYQAVVRLINGVVPQNLGFALGLLAALAAADAALAWYVLAMGKRYDNAPLQADGKHLLTDAASTIGVLIGLTLVHWTQWQWLDPVFALGLAALILGMSWRLLWQSIQGLMDRADPADDAAIRRILDGEVEADSLHSYHKLRHRHVGRFHWVDLHIQIDGSLSVNQGHAIASRLEGRIEQTLSPCNATVHIEPVRGGGQRAEGPRGQGTEEQVAEEH